MKKYRWLIAAVLLVIIGIALAQPIQPIFSTFLALIDVPDTYVGQAGKFTKVNAGETALEFGTPAGAGDMEKVDYDVLDDSIVDGDNTAYGVGWNGVINAASKDAIYDKIETLGGGGDLLADGSIPMTSNWDIGNFDITLKSLTGDGTIEGATITEGGNAVYSSGETPSGELGGTYANITIDDSISVSSWNLTTPTITTSLTTNTPKTIAVAELDRLDGLAGIIVTDATAVTDIEGTGLSIGGATLNWSAASTDLTDTADLLYETELDSFAELDTQIADKSLVNLEDGGTFTGNVIANGNLEVGNAAVSAGVLKIHEDTDEAGAEFASFTVPALAANTVYTLPPDDGDNTEVLQTDGGGTLTWVANAGGGATAWNDISDPGNNGLTTITFDNAELNMFTGDNDAAVSFWTIQNTDADHVGGNMYLLDLDYSADDGDVDADFIKFQDSGSVVMTIQQDGEIATDGGVTAGGTVEGATLTEGGNAVWNATETDILDSIHYVADSIDNEHINWVDIDYLGDEGLAVDPGQVLTVGKSGNVQYNVIQTAINAITDNATGKRYVVLIYPGTYTENVVMEEYVSLWGTDNVTTIITSASGTTLTAPPGASIAEVSNLTIQSTPTADGAIAVLMTAQELEVHNCVIEMTSATNGVIGKLIDQNGGTINWKDCEFNYNLTGSAGADVETHSIYDVAGTSTYHFHTCEIVVDVEDVDDTIIFVNEAAAATVAESFVRDCTIELTANNAAYSGTAGVFYLHGASTEKVIEGCHVHIQSDGNGNGYIFYMDTTGNDGVINATSNWGTCEGFTNNYSGNVAAGDTLNGAFVHLTAASGFTGAGTKNVVSSPTDGSLVVTGTITGSTLTDGTASISSGAITAVASLTFTGADAVPNAAGEIQYDSTIAGMSGGGLRWFDDDSVRMLVDLETDPTDDDYVVAYDSAADGFYMKVDDDSGGSTALNDIGDATGAGLVVSGEHEHIWTWNNDAVNEVFMTLRSTDADTINNQWLLSLDVYDDGDVNGYFFRCRDDTDTTPNTVFEIGADGATTMDAGITAGGTIEAATLTEGGNAVWNATETDILDSIHYVADSIDNEHINWADIDNLGDEGALTVTDSVYASDYVALFEAATGDLAIHTDAGLTYDASTGTLDSTILTEGANAVYNSGETPGGSLGGTWANPTIDDLFIKLGGDVASAGNYDFGGADLELPQAAPAVPDADGEIEVDFTDGTVVIQHGSAHAELGGSTDVVVGKLIRSFGATIFAPDGVNDAIPLKAIIAGEFPHGIVVTEVHMVVGTDVNYTIDVENWDDFDTINGGNPSINSTAYANGNNGEVTDSVITFSTIAAGQIIMLDIPATDIDWVNITVFYYEPIA